MMVKHLFAACRYSMQGLVAAYRQEIAFRLEIILAAILIPAAFVVQVSNGQRALLVLTALLPLIAELINTAVEAAIDVATPDRHPLAKKAKDCGSAAVLLTLLAAAGVWLIILLP